MKKMFFLKLRESLRVMKNRAIKYNKKGLKRVENTIQKTILPKNDLNDENIKIIREGEYLKIIKK